MCPGRLGAMMKTVPPSGGPVSTLCLGLSLLLFVASVSSVQPHLASYQDVKFQNHFPHRPGIRDDRVLTNPGRAQWDVLAKIYPNKDSSSLSYPFSHPEIWGDVWNHPEIPHHRRKRAVVTTAPITVMENRTGFLFDLTQLDTGDSGVSVGNRRFVLDSVSPSNPEMFRVQSERNLYLQDGASLDYEVEALRSITFLFSAQSFSNASDVVTIQAVLTVTNVNEPPVFVTEPQPYLAAVTTGAGAGTLIMTLVAQDPEGQVVGYTKQSVSPNSYNNQLELRTMVVGGVPQYQLRTLVNRLEPESQIITITVIASDSPSNGLTTTATVSVMIGVRPPQFYQNSYQGSILENNQPQHTVYQLGTSQELKVQTKTFQTGALAYSLTTEGGGDSTLFSINSAGAIVSRVVLDYEEVDPKTQTLTVTATQTVGNKALSSSVALTVEIKDQNDNSPIFGLSQYLATQREDIAVGQEVKKVTAEDADTGLNAEIKYSLEGADGYFEIVTFQDPDRPGGFYGSIRVNKTLDYDRQEGPYYNFKVVATDQGSNPKSSTSNVRVTVTNVNDEKPTFVTPDKEEFRVMDDSRVNQVITQIQAVDKDGDSITYSFDGSPGKFAIDQRTGLISLIQRIEDTDDKFDLIVKATDDGSCCPTAGGSFLTSTINIVIQVYGTNTEKPVFTNCANYATSIIEESVVDTSVVTVTATDTDRGPNGQVTYSISSKPDGAFKIDASTGLIRVLNPNIDRETPPYNQPISVTVKGRDGGIPALEGWCNFQVTVSDKNDNPPVFDTGKYVANITMEVDPNIPFMAVRAYDQDVGKNAIITYTLIDDAGGKFGIIEENGFISLLSRMTQSNVQFNLTVMAEDGGNPPLNNTVLVQVNIKQGSSTPPSWDQDYTNRVYTIDETAPILTPIITDMSCQSNLADNSRVEFMLVGEDGIINTQYTKYFSINPSGNTVSVFVAGEFDYLAQREHKIRIRCLNFGAVTLLTEVNPTVRLIDTNNQVPEFQGTTGGRYAGNVQENKPSGTSVITIVASDLDSTSPYNELTFKLTSGQDSFSIVSAERNTAVISTTREFDRETKKVQFVTVEVQDGAASVNPGIAPEPNKATVTVQVTIVDVNDNPPTFNQTIYRISVGENVFINDLIEPAIPVQDKDDSDMGRHSFTITKEDGSPSPFGVRKGLGNLFPIRTLDYEKGDKNFTLKLVADDGKFQATTTVIVTVLDVNDNNPVFTQSDYVVTDITENALSTVQNPFLTLTATDADADRPNNIRYFMERSNFEVNEFFRLDSVSGELSLIKALDRDPPDGFANYQFTVRAEDELTNPLLGYATVSVMPIDVNDNRPQFTSPLKGEIKENSPSGSSVTLIRTADNDFGENSRVSYSIGNIRDKDGATYPDYFTIDSTTGLVQTNTAPESLDRESMDTYLVTVTLRDNGAPPLSSTGTLTITILDINDNAPIFEQEIYSVEMSESQTLGEVTRVVATDADLPANVDIQYELIGDQDAVHFRVEAIDNEGSIQVFKEVDYENDQQRFFNLTVRAKDNAGDSVCYVAITVLDFNDNTPIFDPNDQTVNVSEAADIGTPLATFTAADLDSGINAQFEFSISRESNPRRQFFIDPVTGQVKTQGLLDRETVALHTLTILAIDKGSPARTGTAFLRVILDDVNDNFPTFKEDYHPHILEEEQGGVERVVQEILARDPDAAPFANPYGFQLACDRTPPCDPKFSFSFNPDGDGQNGTSTIRTSEMFDREAQKYYYIPIIMWDMRGSGDPRAMTGTNTLTVTIADINDNNMEPGTQNMFVYNYKGSFGPLAIGRVYVQDLDDWDLPDKTFTFEGPAWLNSYFTVNNDTGMVTMMKGVPSNTASSPYRFTVRVYDKKFGKTVVSTVSVVVRELTEEAVRNSGAVRLKGTSAEQFIKRGSGVAGRSQFDTLQALLAEKLDTEASNVDIISVQDVAGGLTDVRYSVHGSPYYPSSQTDSIVMLYKAEVEQKLGAEVDEVPIDACQDEVFEGGCYNYMNITGQPALVNSNGTSFVGVEVFLQAAEGCRALTFPEPQGCAGDYCYHGGTCVQDHFGVLSCENCPTGFDGPRCQQLRHSFDGNSFALYPTMEQCEDSETSIEFITTQGDGLLFYNGPVTTPEAGKPRDFIALELFGGMPKINIDHGSGAISLSIATPTLADGKWHKINIIRKGKVVEMIVDDCKMAAGTGSESSPPDLSSCRGEVSTVGENSFLNVATLLAVGGRPKDPAPSFPPAGVLAAAGFNGCVKNLVHNSKYYDLHYKDTPAVPSGQNGCPKEDDICGTQCGVNGLCTASFIPPAASCVCKPGWRGNTCNTATTVRDLAVESYLKWGLKNGAQLSSTELDIQLMYRTYDRDGVLLTISDSTQNKTITLELRDGQLQALFDLGDGQRDLLLDAAQASNGQWHTARFSRVMHRTTLTLDHGEGRNYKVSRADLGSNVYMTLATGNPIYAGASPSISNGAETIDRDLTDTCIQDVRLGDAWLPMRTSENAESTVANLDLEVQVKDNCNRTDGCVPPKPCPPGAVCFPLWGLHTCICGPGFHADAAGVCISDCLPNPCFHGAPCSTDPENEGAVVCDCSAFVPWMGQFCNMYPQEGDSDPSVGMAGGTVAAIVVAICLALLLVLLAFILVVWRRRQKGDDSGDKFMVDDDGDYDIRENVIFYDEEGAGEEDQNAYDLAKLPMPVNENFKPMDAMDAPRTSALPLGRRAPGDRPDDADVGDVLHGRLGDADDDLEAPPYDTLTAFDEEGHGSDAGSLSSLGSSSSDASQDYDYLNDWGPKFAKLADMYGAGQE